MNKRVSVTDPGMIGLSFTVVYAELRKSETGVETQQIFGRESVSGKDVLITYSKNFTETQEHGNQILCSDRK